VAVPFSITDDRRHWKKATAMTLIDPWRIWTYRMRLRIQLCVGDVLLGGVRVDFRPTFVEKEVIVVLVECNGCLSIGAEEEALVRSFVDEEMLELMRRSIDG
jgi:hypothetical protein